MSGAREQTTVRPGPPILVTGTHRSGTTFAGEMLGLSDDVHYVFEPFKLNQRPPVSAARLTHWFQYVDEHSPEPLRLALLDTFALGYDRRDALRRSRTPRQALRAWRAAEELARARRRGQRALIKDPIAVLSTAWLAEATGAQVLVMVRHPAAVARSVARLRWSHDFAGLLAQPRLLELLSGEDVDLIRDFAARRRPLLEQAALLWRLVHRVLGPQIEDHPDWCVLRHEDLAARPVAELEKLYGRFDLDFSDAVRDRILDYTTPANAATSTTDFRVAPIDAGANARLWRATLSQVEIDSVRHIVEPLAALHYDPEDWAPDAPTPAGAPARRARRAPATAEGALALTAFESLEHPPEH